MSRQKTVQENRQKLLEAGLNIIIQQGYNRTGIKELVDAVGVPKGSFYNYFDSKEQFGVEVVQFYASQILALLEDAVSNDEVDALSSLKIFFKAVIATFEEKKFREGCLVGNLAAELADTNEVIRLELAKVFDQWQTPVAELLDQAQSDQAIRSDISAYDLANFVWSTFEGAMIRMKVEKSIRPMEQWFDFILNDFIARR